MKKRLIKTISPSVSRKKFLNNYNFKYHVLERFSWMKKHIKNRKLIIEIGSGNGLSKKILKNKIITSDIIEEKWINYKIDMNKMLIPKKYRGKIDIFIFNHSLHHSNNPLITLKKAAKLLRKNGKVLINEPEISLFFKIFLKLCNHERWSMKINDWKDNNATAYLLFGKKKIKDKFMNNFIIEKNNLSEFLIFLNSGGNGVNSPYISLNTTFLKLISTLDKFLILLAPRIFALNRSIVLKKIK